MALVNHHVHSTVSDGHLAPKDVVEEGLAAGLTHLCFVEHHPLPESVRDWSRFYTDSHYLELKDIKKDYFDRISVSIGVEMDWLKDYSDFTRSQIDKRDYDFVMGSIHFMRLKNEPSYLRVHYKCDDALSVLESYGGVEGVVSEYYEQVRLLSESGLFDCVGHLDRIKHVFGEMFTGNEPWYLKQIDDTLDVIEDVGICVELNTSGFDHPCKETYPSTDIFEKIRSRDIPITIGSDGHISPVNKGLAEGYQILKNLEYGAVNVFEGRKRKEVNI